MLRTTCLAAFALATVACSPAPEATHGRNAALPAAGGATQGGDIDVVRILRDVVGRVVVVSDAAGEHNPTEWTFEKDEFKQAAILERADTAAGVALTVMMTTRNNPRAHEDAVQVSGRLRLHYQRKGGGWRLVAIDNLSFKYTIGIAT